MSSFSLPDWARSYLDFLGLSAQSPPYRYLAEFCSAHLSKLAFENISKLIYQRDYVKNGFYIPPIDVYLENMRRFDFGGTCYTLNSHVMRLLQALGFACYHVSLNNSVHIGILVELPEFPGERMYVDFGSAAPFFKPVRFETDPDNKSSFGMETIQLLPDADSPGHYRYTEFRHGKMLDNKWSFHPDRKSRFEDFEEAIAKSNQPGSTFMTKLRCQIWQLDRQRNLSLLNNIFMVRTADGEQTKQ